jgi:intein/homing endonuclease
MTISILSHLGIADAVLRATGLDALLIRKRGFFVSPGNVPVKSGFYEVSRAGPGFHDYFLFSTLPHVDAETKIIIRRLPEFRQRLRR